MAVAGHARFEPFGKSGADQRMRAFMIDASGFDASCRIFCACGEALLYPGCSVSLRPFAVMTGTVSVFRYAKGFAPRLDDAAANAPMITSGINRFLPHGAGEVSADNQGIGTPALWPRNWRVAPEAHAQIPADFAEQHAIG